MSTTITGDLYGFNTEDKSELSRQARDYTYRVTASGGGTLRLKIEHYTGDQLGIGADYVKGTWMTIEERIKIESGHTTTGSFTLPQTLNMEDNGFMRIIFSRGIGTKGVDYEYFMEAA